MKGGSIESYIEQISQYRKWKVGKDSGGYTTVDVVLQDGGDHRVTVMRRLDFNGAVAVFFFCVVGPDDQVKDPAEVLKDNGFMNHGTFAIWGNRLIVMDTQLEEAADIEEVAATIFHLATYADRLEKAKVAKEGPKDIGTILGGPKPGLKPM
jgi:hypothetical protein